MSRQSSPNRWVNGKRTLKWFGNGDEFAGQIEGGYRSPIGECVVEENNQVVDKLVVYDGHEKQGAIDLFLKCGHVTDPQPFHSKDVLGIIFAALRAARDYRINDVTTDNGVDGQEQIILTTDNGIEKQVWVLDAESILETDSEL